jgi:hypothetical protein
MAKCFLETLVGNGLDEIRKQDIDNN